MKIISHRGNLNGVDPKRENTELYIDEAIEKGFDVEIDVWIDGDKLMLGHDKPERETSIEFLHDRREHLWIHAKNIRAFDYFVAVTKNRAFFHEKEDHTLISACRHLWSHNIPEATPRSIIPLLDLKSVKTFDFNILVHGVCTDYPETFKERLLNEAN